MTLTERSNKLKLEELTNLIMVKKTEGNMDVEITGLQMDSRKIEEGNLFICVPAIEGFLEDRHTYAMAAIANGAVALVVEHDIDVEVPKIFVKDARKAMGILASHFYRYPSQEMNLIGITGTNGKTTTSYIIECIFSSSGLSTGVMGNNGIKMKGITFPTDINTQEPPNLQRSLREMKDNGVDYCAIEVSSQGIDMQRVGGCDFRTAIFTNLTQDHLDYHGTLEQYRRTKSLLFSGLGYTPLKQKYAILNADDPNFKYFYKSTSVEVITYGLDHVSDVSATNITMSSSGIRFLLSTFIGETEIEIKLVGRFNVYNALASITAALIEGITLEQIKSSLLKLEGIKGRMEIVDVGQEFLVLIDYAHTPDALESVLKSTKEFSRGKIITVFGCGGDRDKQKREQMGKIASMFSDLVYITSDNPRSENPFNIMDDIEKGLKNTSALEYELIVDRETAIRKAIKKAEKNDIVLIAGKGHETYQIFNDETIHFDDKEVAKAAISYHI